MVVAARRRVDEVKTIPILLGNFQWRMDRMRSPEHKQWRVRVVVINDVQEMVPEHVLLEDAIGICRVQARVCTFGQWVGHITRYAFTVGVTLPQIPWPCNVLQLARRVARLHVPIVVLMVKVYERRLVPSSLGRMVGRRHACIPFACHRGSIPGGCHLCCDPRHIARDSAKAAHRIVRVVIVRVEVLYIHMNWVATTLKGGARRGAELVCVMTVQLNTLLDKGVHVRRLHLFIPFRPVPASVGPSVIISEDHQDVGPGPLHMPGV
mmetsp:Transcript_13787/g.50206  ORF Transcript_13787/g.50206 Transcript_13787/m.50206 type:complete len:265 (-) Transcript_13787:180-974(-)